MVQQTVCNCKGTQQLLLFCYYSVKDGSCGANRLNSF